MNDILKDSLAPEVLTSIRKHGIPFKKWPHYRAQYPWLPEFVINAPLKKFNMSFYNGECAKYIYPLEKDVLTNPHPVPDSIKFAYTPKDSDTEYLYYIHFDEKEMFDVFAKLAAKQLPMQLEIHPTLPIQKTQIRLKNKDEAIVLKKFVIEKID